MNKKIVIPIVVVIAIIGAAVAINSRSKDSMSGMQKSTTTAQPSAAETVAPNTVILKDLDFATKKLTVKKRTTVTWLNKDTAKHTVTFDDAALADASSKLFGNGETFTYTFNTVGTYNYHCMPHPFMKAAVEVTE